MNFRYDELSGKNSLGKTRQPSQPIKQISVISKYKFNEYYVAGCENVSRGGIKVGGGGGERLLAAGTERQKPKLKHLQEYKNLAECSQRGRCSVTKRESWKISLVMSHPGPRGFS